MGESVGHQHQQQSAMSMLISVLVSLASVAITSAKPGGMMGMGGVVAMRRNADHSSDYAFDVSDLNSGHPDISDYVLDIKDYNDVGHQDYNEVGHQNFNAVGHQDYVERGVHLGDYVHEYDYEEQHDFEYDLGSFDYY